MTKKERIAATFTGITLFFVAALFSIVLILGLLDFGSTNNRILPSIGQMLLSVYGICSTLIPTFFFISGVFCISAKWNIQRAFILLVSIIPFFTLVLAERLCITISNSDTSPLAYVKISSLLIIAFLLVVLEYLFAITLSSFIEKKLKNNLEKQNNKIQEIEWGPQFNKIPKADPKDYEDNNELEYENSNISQKKNSISFLKNQPKNLKNLFIKKLSFQNKKNFKEKKSINEDELNIIEESIQTKPEKKFSYNWSIDENGNNINSNKSIIDDSISQKENIIQENNFENSTQILEEKNSEDETIISSDDNTQYDDFLYNDDIDIIDQFEQESGNLIANIEDESNITSKDEIHYDIDFENQIEQEEIQNELSNDTLYNEEQIYEDLEEKKLLEEISNNEINDEVDESFMEDQIISNIQNEDKTTNFNPESTSLGDIFSQMDLDARKVVEKKSTENLEINNEKKSSLSNNSNKPVIIEPISKKKKIGSYKISTNLLTAYAENEYWIIDEETKLASINLQDTLKEFSIRAEITGIRKGPVVTMFEILPAPGVKLSKIVGLADNIALRLAAQSVRIVAPIPGKRAVGIEIPNKARAIVSFRECIEQNRSEWKKMAVPVILGKDIQGETQIIDLVKTPHLLIAGSTGAGKSVCVNSIILSILYKKSPSDIKMILIDPKVVELKLYNHIPHLLTPVITESKKAMQALQYCLCEMERRYAVLDSLGCRDISSYNKKIIDQHIATEKIPYLIVIIDEFADLMATTGKQLEGVVARLCAMSRAVGIHLVLATQRPSVDVITGLIKANIPSRIAFMVAAKTDSRIIIDQVGAEKLLGKGDMLYASATDPFPMRIQGTFVSDQEVENVVNAVKEWGEPEYIDEEIFVEDDDEESSNQISLFNDGADDPLYDKALEIVIQAGKASASYIQRRLSIGYNRAARLVELMEERGIVGPANGSKPREIIHIP